MSKYIIEIDDERLKEGCEYCPLNYDYDKCLAHNGEWRSDPMHAWDLNGSPDGRTENCPLVPYEKRTTTRNGKHKKRYGNIIPLCECCGYAIGDDRYNFCPKCGAEIEEGK